MGRAVGGNERPDRTCAIMDGMLGCAGIARHPYKGIMVNTLPQALAYLEAGYSVIPCGDNKRPLLGAWKLYQTELPARNILAGWWKELPTTCAGFSTNQPINGRA